MNFICFGMWLMMRVIASDSCLDFHFGPPSLRLSTCYCCCYLSLKVWIGFYENDEFCYSLIMTLMRSEGITFSIKDHMDYKSFNWEIVFPFLKILVKCFRCSVDWRLVACYEYLWSECKLDWLQYRWAWLFNF